MANYNVDIVVGLKGEKKLNSLSREINKTLKASESLQKVFSRQGKLTQSVNSYSDSLVRAKRSLDMAIMGTVGEAKAVREFAQALGTANSARERQNKLIQDQIQLNQKNANNFARFSKSASGFAIANDPVSKSIRRNQRNQARRANTGNRFRGQSSPLTSPISPGYSEPIFPGQAQSLFAGGTFRNNLMSNINMSRAGREASNFGFGLAGDPVAKSIRRNQQTVAKRTAMQKKLDFQNFLKEKKANKEIRNIKAGQLRLERAQNRALKERVITTQTLAKTTKTAGGTATQGQGFFRGGARGAIGSAAIGGGFPLLFGQGALGAVGGGVGGAIGGAIGGQFGFSLSIIGTVIAQRIQEAIDFRKEIEKVNIAIEKTGGTSKISATDITVLSKSLKITKDEALQAANAFAAFGAQSALALAETFKDRSTFDLYANLNKDAKTFIGTVDTLFKKNELGIGQAQKALGILNQRGLKEASIFVESLKFQEKIKKEISEQVPLQKDVNAAQVTYESFFNKMSGQPLRSFMLLNKERQKEIQLLITAKGQMEARIGTEEERVQKRMSNVRAEIEAQRELTKTIERELIIQQPKDELERLLDPLIQVDLLSKSIGASFSESFKGIVRGSMTAQEALRNLFNRTADHFLDMAAQILAAQIRSGIMGIFSNLLNPFGSTMGGSGYFDPVTGLGTAGPNFGLAEGGTARSGRSYLVGERGPEIFTPKNTGTVTPNHELGSMGGSTNIVVNVDASGSSVEGDEEDSRSLGVALSVAIETELIKQKRPGGLLA